MYMEDKVYSFTSALSAAAVLWTLLPKEKEGKKVPKYTNISEPSTGIISLL